MGCRPSGARQGSELFRILMVERKGSKNHIPSWVGYIG